MLGLHSFEPLDASKHPLLSLTRNFFHSQFSILNSQFSIQSQTPPPLRGTPSNLEGDFWPRLATTAVGRRLASTALLFLRQRCCISSTLRGLNALKDFKDLRGEWLDGIARLGSVLTFQLHKTACGRNFQFSIFNYQLFIWCFREKVLVLRVIYALCARVRT